MRNRRSIFLIVLLIVCLFGCSKKEIEESDQGFENELGTFEEKQEKLSVKILVVYFSCTGEQYQVGVIEEGNTAIVAKMIAGELDGDLFEVKPVDESYKLSYKDLTDYAKTEQRENARPEYVREDEPDLKEYDVIFIGAPVWWGDWPMIMYTYFENNADVLNTKTLVPFSTHGGSGLAGFDKKLSGVLKDAKMLEGLAINGADAQNDRNATQEKVREWLDQLND